MPEGVLMVCVLLALLGPKVSSSPYGGIMTELEDDEEVNVRIMVTVGDREALCLEMRVPRGNLRAGFFSPV